MLRRKVAAGLAIVIMIIAPAAGARGSSASPVDSSEALDETVAHSPFPSAEDIGAELETHGIHAWLGHDWSGVDLDDDVAGSAWTQSFRTPEATLPEQQVGVIVDIVHFESVEDAMRHVDEEMSTDDQPGFETGLSTDWEASSSHKEEDGPTVATAFVREGPVALAISTFRWDTTSPAASTVAVARLVLDRLTSPGEWVIVLASDADDPPPTAVESGAVSAFPTAEEVSELLGVDVGLRGIEPGLSQLWEGIEFDWQELPSAYIGMYWAPPYVTEEPLVGVFIDVAEFATVAEAMRHADTKFVDYPEGFETDLNGDYVLTHTFPSDDLDGSFIVHREGPVIVLVTTFSYDGTDTEAASEEIVELVLSRLDDGA